MKCYFIEGKACPVPLTLLNGTYCFACAQWAAVKTMEISAKATTRLANSTVFDVPGEKEPQRPDERKDVA